VDGKPRTKAQLQGGIGVVKNLCGAAERHKLELIAEADDLQMWRDDGAKDMTQWVSAHFGVSHWVARRWIDSSHALRELPGVARALSSGRLSLVKTVELTRFATPETEAQFIRWALGVSAGAIRRRADAAQVDPLAEVRAEHEARSLSWWYEHDRRLHLEGTLPSEQGAVVVRAIERLADRLPADPERESNYTIDARRADALVALASQGIADDPDSARARINLHVELTALTQRHGSAEIEGGGIVHPEVAARLCCDSIVQTVVHGQGGHTVGLGRATRNVSEALYRQLRLRDGGCTFPGCHHKRYVHAHHIWWWEWGGPTDLDNLVLVCDFHHKLVHEGGWRVELGREAGVVHWFKPGYVPYEPFALSEPNRAPPVEADNSGIEASLVPG
jgi:Domain of unknown function (DUF222)